MYRLIGIVEYIVITSSLLLTSCHLGERLVIETNEVDFINKTDDVIHGVILDIEIVGGTTVAVCDTLLMYLTSNPKALLQVYNSQTLKPLAMLCQQGRASNEFSDNKINRFYQIFLRKGDIICVLRGEGGYVLKEINVSASLREGHTVVEGINNSIPYGCGRVVGLDQGIDRVFTFNNHNYNIDMDDFNPPFFSIIDKANTKEIQIYKRLVDFEDNMYSTFWYSGSICKHPTRNIVAQCMNTIDYIHFFDLDNDKYYSIHQKGTPTFDDIKVTKKIVNDAYEYDNNHFSESIGTESMLLVLYLNGDYRKKSLKQGNGGASELLAFDWEGNYLGGVKLDLAIHNLAYDSKRCKLFGYRINDEKTIMYDLTNFMKSIGK